MGAQHQGKCTKCMWPMRRGNISRAGQTPAQRALAVQGSSCCRTASGHTLEAMQRRHLVVMRVGAAEFAARQVQRHPVPAWRTALSAPGIMGLHKGYG